MSGDYSIGSRPSKKKLAELYDTATKAVVARTLADHHDPDGDDPYSAIACEAAEWEQELAALCPPPMILVLIGIAQGRVK